MNTRVIETPTATFRMEEDGILRMVMRPASMFTLADARQNTAVAGELCGRRKVPVLVDARGIMGADREARAYLAGAEAMQYIAAGAMIVESAVSRVIMNFFVNVNQPPSPVRIFTDEVEALKWLKGYL